ncbi:MAG: peptidogalycan biosysnthesis protein [Hyphomonadaceae bacterium]
MLETRVVSSIAEIGRERWDRCFAGALEGYDYLMAVETAGLPGFVWRYACVERDGALAAAAPGFFTHYALETTLGAAGRKVAEEARKLWPAAMKLRLACLGSPCTETVSLGFAPEIAPPEKAEIARTLVRGFERAALDAGAGLLAVKDTPADQAELCAEAFGAIGYRSIAAMPTAQLDIDFDSEEAYLARLSADTRKDMRRKLKSFAAIRIETRTAIADVAGDIARLYADTHARADLTFEELTPAYFSNVLREMPGRAFCQLYYAGDEMLAFNLLLQNETTLLDKFFCMDGARGRAHNLYFLSWFANVRHCLAHGLKRYQSGQAGYANKLRLGSRLEPTKIYFRHRNALLSRALHMAAPLFASDPAFSPGAA